MVRNLPEGREETRTIITQERSRVTFSGRVVGFVHGDLAPGRRGSLIVFDFQFGRTDGRDRIKSALISVKFTGQNNDASRGPNVISLAPQGSMRLFPREQTETRSVGFTPSIEVGGISGVGGVARETVHTRQSAMLLRGGAVFQGRQMGEPNAAQWFLEENEAFKDGLTCKLRCVVLLARPDDERFQAKVTVETTVSGTLFQSKRFFGRSEQDDPLIFNPASNPERRPGGINLDSVDPENLEATNLKSLAYIHSQDFPQGSDDGFPGQGESLESGPPVSKSEWKEGNTRDQILLGFARGEYDSSFQFNSFSTIAIFNLYLYQHRLVKLETDLKKKIRDGGEVDDAEADNLAKLLREYHEALRAYRELSVFEGVPSEVARNTNVELRAKLDNDNYSWDSDLSMVDLFGEPTKDDVQRWVQKRLSQLWRRKGPTEQHIVTTTRAEAYNPLLAGGGVVEATLQRRETRLVASTMLNQPRPVGISPLADKLAGFLVAFVGGAFLLAPMCELAYVRSQEWQIVSVVLWVLFFAFAVAATSKARNVELLGATAAYAAVLVVFVGQSQT
ncbi:hypothetical protein F4677DRAFT_444018 [Hypoxylon crocopeplum]|nr:hypothetical protein F4677DRAFT_444018 [Hypoxylon crocopeplum]